ncbi:MAG: GTPase ObgE [Planctomycetota bacterium]
MFVDRVVIDVEAGRGGDGCRSFRRERFVPKGGPDGGDGGDGGSVIIIAEAGINNLTALAHRKQWRADRGRHGQGSRRHGRSGTDLVIKVPPGTVVMDAQHELVIKDLAELGDQVTAARGGKGGRGNAHFKSSTNRAPRQTTSGGEGESRKLVLELKMIADVGLIGKPNAGKSTLLSRLTHARPEIADYPFTTKHPNLGKVQLDLERAFIVADIPGLIEGAHEGVGLGHEFLRHIQRTGVLVHLVEPAPADGSDPCANYFGIREELIEYDAELGERPEIVVVTKAELPEASSVLAELGGRLEQEPLLISAVTGEGLNLLSSKIWTHLEARQAT